MRILVCGGRNFGNLSNKVRGSKEWDKAYKEYRFGTSYLNKLVDERSIYYNPNDNWLPSDIEIIHGGTKGGDSIGDQWAVVNWCKVHEFKADWNKYGKRAGYLRNVQMLEEGKPDLVVAFPGGKGTAMMIDLARKAGLEVIEVKYET